MHDLAALRRGDYNDSRLTQLKLTERLSAFPPEILDLADTLLHLDVSGTGLSTLPAGFDRLQKLKIAFFSNCEFRVFPKELSTCHELEMVAFRGNQITEIPEEALPPNLKWLILTNNEIEELPRSIGQCSRLQKCMLAGNRLHKLPVEMSECKKLSLLRLSANRFDTLPQWLFELPELSFLSFAGNPCLAVSNDTVSIESGLEEVSWTGLQLEHILGEGASGIIYKGTLQRPTFSQDVAIKLFKGDVTSDGTPLDEMNACMKAGSHANLIDPLGRIYDHPDKKGLVLELIPPAYRTLGNPPSLQSCTRDCFPAGVKLSTSQGLTILHGIASAAAHLHERDIAHGDLYAHNILVREDGHSLLGDFGAATLYGDFPHEQLEILAFAHLIEDVWNLIRPNFDEDELRVSLQLKALHRRCALPVVTQRPQFTTIADQLDLMLSELTVVVVRPN